MTETNPSYVSMPFASVAAFTSTNQQIMKTRIKNALKKAFKSTYLYDDGEDGDEVAEKFANTAAGPITDAVVGFVDGCIKAQSITINVPPTVTSPAGPCTGAIAPTFVQIQ